MDKLSYALGHNIGHQLIGMGLQKSLNIDDYAAGIADVLQGREPKMTHEEVHQVLEHYFTELEERQQAEAAEYNSSLNPAFIPGRYMHLTEPRTWFMKDGVMQIPASVTPIIRFPLFWLALHNLPEGLYHWMTRRVLKKDGYFVTYFHPWEFYELKEHPEFKMPFIIKNHSGQQMCDRLDRLVKMLLAYGHEFITYTEFVGKCKK